MPTLYLMVNETGNRNRTSEMFKFRFWLVHWIDPRSIEYSYACLFVSVFVCLFVRAITSERLNIGRSNLAVRYIVQKSRLSSKLKFKGQGHQGQKAKNC